MQNLSITIFSKYDHCGFLSGVIIENTYNDSSILSVITVNKWAVEIQILVRIRYDLVVKS